MCSSALKEECITFREFKCHNIGHKIFIRKPASLHATIVREQAIDKKVAKAVNVFHLCNCVANAMLGCSIFIGEKKENHVKADDNTLHI